MTSPHTRIVPTPRSSLVTARREAQALQLCVRRSRSSGSDNQALLTVSRVLGTYTYFLDTYQLSRIVLFRTDLHQKGHVAHRSARACGERQAAEDESWQIQ